MARSVLKSLKTSTLLTFFEICRKWKLKKEVDYDYKAHEGLIKWANGSGIYLKELFAWPSDPEFDNLGSTEYTGGFIDEGSQVTIKAKNILTSRFRYKLEEFNLIPKLLIASNPCKHWAYYEFYKPNKEKTLPYFRKFIQSLATDNPKISPHYIENLKKLDKNSRERLLFGNWEYDDDPTRLFEYDNLIDLFTNEALRGLSYCVVDVAGRGRDRTMITIWDGLFITKIYNMNNISSEELDEILIRHNVPRSRCVVDEDGVGFGLVKDMKTIKGFVNNSKPITKHKEDETEKTLHNYRNLKAQCWFQLANYISEGRIGIFRDIKIELREMIIEDLEQIKQKDPGKDAPLNILSKEEIKLVLGRSTDIGDAIMMRMYFELNEKVTGFMDYV